MTPDERKLHESGDLPHQLKKKGLRENTRVRRGVTAADTTAWSSVVRGVQGNFDHLQGWFRTLVQKFNALVDDLAELGDYVEATAGSYADHTHTGVPGEGGSLAVDHGALSGLGDNDHPQYATDTDLSNHEADTSTHGVAEVAGIADITFETLDAAGDVGTGASTLAEGDHTHVGGGSTIDLEDDTTPVGTFDTIDFGTGLAVTDDGGGHATVDATGSGSTIDIEEGGSAEGSADTLDFDDSDFNVSVAASEASIGLNYGTGAGQPAEGNHSHGGGSGTGYDEFILKSADETTTNDVTLTDDSELLFAILANEVWFVEVDLFIDSSSTPDFKACIAGPTGATGRFMYIHAGGTPNHQDIGTGVALISTGWPNEMKLVCVVENGANAGNISVQWAQNTSNGATTGVKVGSSLRAKKVA